MIQSPREEGEGRWLPLPPSFSFSFGPSSSKPPYPIDFNLTPNPKNEELYVLMDELNQAEDQIQRLLNSKILSKEDL